MYPKIILHLQDMQNSIKVQWYVLRLESGYSQYKFQITLHGMEMEL